MDSRENGQCKDTLAMRIPNNYWFMWRHYRNAGETNILQFVYHIQRANWTQLNACRVLYWRSEWSGNARHQLCLASYVALLKTAAYYVETLQQLPLSCCFNTSHKVFIGWRVSSLPALQFRSPDPNSNCLEHYVVTISWIVYFFGQFPTLHGQYCPANFHLFMGNTIRSISIDNHWTLLLLQDDTIKSQ